MNEKTNGKEIGVFKKYELVTSHTCRRSFATNLYKQGVKPFVIMATTGHTTEKEFFKYLKVTPTEHADHLQTLYDKQEKENPTKAPLLIVNK